MSKRCFPVVLTLFAVLLQAPVANANDSITLTRPEKGLGLQRSYVPRENPGQKSSVPITPELVIKAVDKRVQALFDRAADPSTHLVTIASADKAGVGYFIDNFAKIDSDQDGSLRFSEVKNFLDPQSPIERPVSREIQIIE